MASSHIARQGEKRGSPVSRTDELRRPTLQMRGSLSDQQLTTTTTTTKLYPIKWGRLHGSNGAIVFFHKPYWDPTH